MPREAPKMHKTHASRRVRVITVAAMVVFGLVAASCTNPAPPGGFTLKFQADKITNISFKGDYPLTFWDNDTAEEPYLVHLGLRLALNPVKVTTSVASTYLNNGAYIGKISAGQTLADTKSDGLTWSGVQLPDTADLANGAPLEILGSVEFLFDRDQLIPFGIANILTGVSQVINQALPPILANGGLPSDPQALLTFLGGILPSVFTTIGGAVQAVIGQLLGSDTFFGFQPVFFIAAGGGLGDFLKNSLPSLMGLVNAVLKAQPDSAFPNGLPLSIGVAKQPINLTFGTAPTTSVYTVHYSWS
jgi:hypothetical protein